jgi:L-aminopeptidase/D-esterase-like protein
VNALGDPLASTWAGVDVDELVAGKWLDDPKALPFGNTTIGVVVTNAALTKVHCHLIAEGAHDGLARSVAPVHTQSDGDAFVAAATGTVEAPVHAVRALAATVIADAVRSLAT